MKTFVAKPREVLRQWYIIDAKTRCLGRLAVDIAMLLRGKHKPEYTPHVDTGDHVIVINAADVAVSGKKKKNKIYHHHTGYVGGLKSCSFENMQKRHPGRALEIAVRGMLPKGPLGRSMFHKLKVVPGETHPFAPQKPIVYPANGIFRT